jgi:hypothetical protein
MLWRKIRSLSFDGNRTPNTRISVHALVAILIQFSFLLLILCSTLFTLVFGMKLSNISVSMHVKCLKSSISRY